MKYIPSEGYELNTTLFNTNVILEQCTDIERFTIFKVYSKSFNEVDIRRIKIDGDDVGFIIPSFSLLSMEHDYYNVNYFQSFCDACIKWFLINHDSTEESEVELESLFSEDLGFIVLSNSRFTSTEENNRKLFFELLSYGTYVDIRNSNTQDMAKNALFPERTLPESTRISMTSKTNKAILDDFIFETFYSILFKETDHFLQFFYLYQSIETLIEFVMAHEYSTVKGKIDEFGNSVTSQQLKKLVETINESLQERKRINKLCHDYTANYSDDFNTKESLINFIIEHLNSEFDPDSDIGSSIYEIRNKSFHEFRTLRNSEKLSEITSHSFNYILHLISSYKH
ncbi:hypothetical protein [Photobacterium sanguinicancri]|uniref:hypothetical protein n=1 Tax=Photobacterium sanguinicancri TaxID=875932 RepID=UPI0026E36BE4|nr:hypothetical protein [Photobacterium sanguinicancri]MDO6501205.1 hypothetical protein [Photobacterium sanguinicancri]